jgi:hypothetical protein
MQLCIYTVTFSRWETPHIMDKITQLIAHTYEIMMNISRSSALMNDISVNPTLKIIVKLIIIWTLNVGEMQVPKKHKT